MTGDGRWIVSDDHGGGFSDGGVRANGWTPLPSLRSNLTLASIATRFWSPRYMVLHIGPPAPLAGQDFRCSPFCSNLLDKTHPEDVAGEMESVLKGLGTNFSQAVRLLAMQTAALGGMLFAAGIPRKAR